MLAEQIELANMNQENPFQTHGTIAAPQEELLVVDENEKGDSDIKIDDQCCIILVI